MKDMAIGIGFYRREQWQRLRETAVDAHLLEASYDDWIEVLDSAVTKITDRGLEPRLIEVDVNTLLAYCKQQGIPNNAEARSKFIAKLTSEADEE
jgi:hypothetical protein